MVGSENGKLKKEEVNAVGGNEPVGTKPNYASLGLTKPVDGGGNDGAPAAPFNAFAGNGIVGRFGPAGASVETKPDYASMSLSKPVGAPVGGGAANVPAVQNAPTFQKDDTKKDGGFFGWLGGLIKKRPGIRSGESADEYDERMTRNKMRIATLADAIRHMGNIYNTSKGAPLQRFNNPVEGLQSGLQQRKNERARQAAADADAAYKNANLRMKQASADADRAYKAMNIELKQKAGERARAKAEEEAERWQKQFEYRQKKDKDDFEYRQKKDKDDFEYRKSRDKVKDGQWDASYKLAWYKANKAGDGGSGSSGDGFKSVTNLSTPKGHMNRKKDLNSIEKKQIRDYLYKNGFITKSAAAKYDGALSEPERGAILNGWIGLAANAKGTRADKFRKVLTDHYGYVETKTVSSNNAPAKSSPIRWQGSGSKPKAKAKGGTANGKGTDWSKYVK